MIAVRKIINLLRGGAFLALLLFITAQARAQTPEIREFKLLVENCTVPNPDQAVVSYKVSGVVRRISVNAYRGIHGYRIHHRYYPTPENLSIVGVAVKDPEPISSTRSYELVVEGADGQEVKQRIRVRYSHVIDLELTGIVTLVRPFVDDYLFQISFRGREITEVKVAFSDGMYEAATRATILTDARRPTPDWITGLLVFRLPRSENRYLRERYEEGRWNFRRFTFQAFGYPSDCPPVMKEASYFYETERSRARRSDDDSSGSRERTPPPVSSTLPDLVPVILSFDGSTVSFYIENQGRAAVSRRFVVKIESPGGRDYQTRTIDRLGVGERWYSDTINVALIGADGAERGRAYRVVIIADAGTVVDESNEGNNSEHRDR